MSSSSPPILEPLIHRPTPLPGLTGLCVNYEEKKWRCDQLAQQILRQWLPEFSLRHGELADLDPQTMGELMVKAAKAVYATQKFRRRGELGELLLHAAMRQLFQTLPAVSKIYYKDGPNETVKGFDAVHVVPTDEGLELWLGESKFYSSISAAIRDVVVELNKHFRTNYLKTEFLALQNKIDDTWPHATQLRKLLHENTTLDKVFTVLSVPVLLTYDSETLAKHNKRCDSYEKEIREEWERHYKSFSSKNLPEHIKIHLLLVPLHTKRDLTAAFNRQLRVWQQL
jgi:hypothetical protein